MSIAALGRSSPERVEITDGDNQATSRRTWWDIIALERPWKRRYEQILNLGETLPRKRKGR